MSHPAQAHPTTGTSVATGRRTVSRRTVLRTGGTVAGALALQQVLDAPLALLAQNPSPAVADAVLDVVRSDLQLRFRIELFGLRVVGDQLLGIPGGGAARIAVEIGSQHVDESIIDTSPPSTSPVANRSAAPTRLVFAVVPPIAFDLDTLLDWSTWQLALDGRAAEDQAATNVTNTGAPGPDVTQVVLPQGLTMSPLVTGTGGLATFMPRVALDADPQTFGDVSVVWRALLTQAATSVTAQTPLRALWTPGYVYGGVPKTTVGPTIGGALTTLDKQRIVQATGDWSTRATQQYPAHQAINAQGAIQLSAVGASADLAGEWTGPGPLAVYTHAIRNGRTTAATVTTRGYLMPFGHAASLTRTVVREFVVDTAGDVVAGLYETVELVIPSSTATPALDLFPDGGRAWPFTQVTLLQVGAAAQGRQQVGTQDTDLVFAITDETTNQLVSFSFFGADRAGNVGIRFDLPGVFVSAELAFDPGSSAMVDIAAFYATTVADPLDMEGQPFALVEPFDPAKVDQVIKQVLSMALAMEAPAAGVTDTDLTEAGQVALVPRVVAAEVSDPTVDSLRGTSAPQPVILHPDYLAFGYDAQNVGGSYLRFGTPDARERLDLGYAGGGGSLAKPDLVVDEYNAALGVSAALDTPSWDPLANLQLSSKLFGAIPLSWILPSSITLDVGDPEGSGLPVISVELTATEATSLFCWSPPLRSLSIGGSPTFIVTDDLRNPDAPASFDSIDDPFDGDTEATFKVTNVVALQGGSASTDLEITIENVVAQLPPVVPIVQLYIQKLTYSDPSDARANLDLDLLDVQFTGVLNFLDRFQGFLKEVGVSGDVEITSEAIVVSGEIMTPALSLGIFNLSPLPISSSLTLPLDDTGRTEFEFAIGRQSDPFRFTLFGVGGSGWFEVVAAPHPDGIVRLSAALAVTVEFSVNVLLANAYLRASLGLVLEIDEVQQLNPVTGQQDTIDEFTLTIFVELSAGISALGLVSASATLTLSAEYSFTFRAFTGSVVVVLAIDSLFGSTSKTFEFVGNYPVGPNGVLPGAGQASGQTAFAQTQGGQLPPEPTFRDKYTEAEWLTYCGKFA